jgi:hypothetical protein
VAPLLHYPAYQNERFPKVTPKDQDGLWSLQEEEDQSELGFSHPLLPLMILFVFHVVLANEDDISDTMPFFYPKGSPMICICP